MAKFLSIGLVGLGRMGAAIFHRLSTQGREVVGWDHNPEKVRHCESAGLRAEASAAAVAQRADVILSSIIDDRGATTLFTGESGFLSTDVKDKLFIELSTLQPATVRALALQVEAAGGGLIDSPILGTVPNVAAGDLIMLVGGRSEHLAKALPILNLLSQEVIHLGPSGSGSAMKLGVNLGLAAYMQSIAEALAMGEKQGLEPPTMLRILQKAVTANAWLDVKMPILQGGTGPVSMDIMTMRKDIMSAVATGTTSGVSMPMTSGVLAALSAAVAEGRGDRDIAELPRFFREKRHDQSS